MIVEAVLAVVELDSEYNFWIGEYYYTRAQTSIHVVEEGDKSVDTKLLDSEGKPIYKQVKLNRIGFQI